jgi:hypothetical protein
MSDIFIEWFGYAASAVVAVSLTMSSVAKLRWYNLFGAVLFAIYGLFIGSLPVFFLNSFIAGADIYYLIKLYRTKEHFSLLATEHNSSYIYSFLDFYKSDIQKIFPNFTFDVGRGTLVYLLLRDAVPAGIFIGKKSGKTFNIILDYVTPRYRDLKLARFIFEDCASMFTDQGITQFESGAHSKEHESYLHRLGFSVNDNNSEIKSYIFEISQNVDS